MPPLIHPTAIIDASARIAPEAAIGPFSVIGPDVTIGEGTRIAAHVVLEANVSIGRDCRIEAGAVIGGEPQDLNYKGEPTAVRIGDRVTLREYVTVNRGTGEGSATEIADECFLMAYCHVGHNCQLGTGVIMANSVQLGGYVTIGDHAFMSATAIVHQFVTIGRLTIMGGASGTRQDLPPFAMCDGHPAEVRGINKIGLRRQGIGPGSRAALHQAFRTLWFSEYNTSDAILKLRETSPRDPLVEVLLDFVENSKRGIRRPKHLRGPHAPQDPEHTETPATEATC